MKYGKLPLTFEEQADRLLGRGLVANRDELITRLAAVNYYRLSGYLYPFRRPDDSYVPGTTLDLVWRRYVFDRRLRVLILDAVERIEVAVRTKLIYHLSHHRPTGAAEAAGAFGYLDHRFFPGFKTASEFLKWRSKLAMETDRAKSEKFVQHFRTKYGAEHPELPGWMVAELMSFGAMLTMAKNVVPEVQNAVADDYGFSVDHFMSWLQALMVLRNACAHHDRIWNRGSGKAGKTQKNKFPLWHQKPVIPNDRTGYLLTICHYWLGLISPTTRWRDRLFALFDEFPDVPLDPMGLPADWRIHPLWK
ncbi:MAG: Abi family protein [Verrucomicrobia bacterium]|nr:MAG: Abi family protein [Verrucomicrobiota bacterium]TAE87507.1 MAG: Abi family protein [Verrucomicrobiota bacterium]TAF25788.1 MAG: Abi family protein [Verrucomicrobiota bacterium]TAF41576.1 MAG: Abi family protein [Verrucomicrobiota bacterium]